MVAERQKLGKEMRAFEDGGSVLCFYCGGCYMGVLCVFGETHCCVLKWVKCVACKSNFQKADLKIENPCLR